MKLKRFSSSVPKMKSKYFPILIGLLLLVIVLLFVNMRMFNTYEGFNVPSYTSTQLTTPIPFGPMTQDTRGNIYTLSGPPNGLRLYKITINGNNVRATLYNPNVVPYKFTPPKMTAMTFDYSGNLYISSERVIYKMGPSGTATIYAGKLYNYEILYPDEPGYEYGYVNGPALSSKFGVIGSMVFDSSGNLYVGDGTRRCIRKVAPNGGEVTTLAGPLPKPETPDVATPGGYRDGPASSALFNSIRGIVIDSARNLYITDAKNIRKIAANGGTVSTIAKDFNWAHGITIDSQGNLYIVDSNNKDVTMLAFPSYSKTIIASAGKVGTYPTKIFLSPLSLYVQDGNIQDGSSNPNKLWNLQRAGAPAPAPAPAPPPAQGGSNAQPPPTAFRGSVFSSGFVNSMGITIDSNGDIYATNGSKPGSTLSKISTTGTTAGAITRFGNASFFNLMDIKLDSLRNVYITDAGLQRVYKISTNGNTGIYSGVNVGYINGPALSAAYNTPDQMVFDTANNLYVCDTNNHCIRRIAANGGAVTTYAGAPPTAARLPTSGSEDGTLAISKFNQPKGITIDRSGNLYVTDSGNKSVRVILTSGQVKTIATGFNSPNGITIDPAGNLYVVDSGNRSVTMLAFPSYNKSIISIATGTSGWTLPVKIARSSAGTFYVTDAGQNKIWKV